MGKHWLDKYIKEQKENRRILGKDAAKIQEIAEREGFENYNEKKKYAVFQKGLRFGEIEEVQVTNPMSKARAEKHAKRSRELFKNMSFTVKEIKK